MEDRKKDSSGNFIGAIPVPPTTKRIDYVSVSKGVVGHEHSLAIGVWDDDKYTPINRDELEFFARQYTFDPSITGAVLVTRPAKEQ